MGETSSESREVNGTRKRFTNALTTSKERSKSSPRRTSNSTPDPGTEVRRVPECSAPRPPASRRTKRRRADVNPGRCIGVALSPRGSSAYAQVAAQELDGLAHDLARSGIPPDVVEPVLASGLVEEREIDVLLERLGDEAVEARLKVGNLVAPRARDEHRRKRDGAFGDRDRRGKPADQLLRQEPAVERGLRDVQEPIEGHEAADVRLRLADRRSEHRSSGGIRGERDPI